MDTSIETLMRQYSETTKTIKIYEDYLELKEGQIDELTRQIRPKKWLNNVDKNNEMFKLYARKLELIAEYDKCSENLRREEATLAIRYNLIKDREFRM
jgi:capsid portal protein